MAPGSAVLLLEALFLHRLEVLLVLLERHTTLERAQVVEEDDPIEVIDLVLDRDREQSIRLELELLAVAIERLDDDLIRALDLLVGARDAQAPLFPDDAPFGGSGQDE